MTAKTYGGKKNAETKARVRATAKDGQWLGCCLGREADFSAALLTREQLRSKRRLFGFGSREHATASSTADPCGMTTRKATTRAKGKGKSRSSPCGEG